MKTIGFLAFALTLSIFLAGCVVRTPQVNEPSVNEQPVSQTEVAEQNQEEQNTQTPVTEQTAKIVLYFGDEQAMGFNKEERVIEELTPERLIEELIVGPKYDQNIQTIPDGTKLIDIRMDGNVAYVNFSKEIVENHWGGSAGESMTLGSIVNTLVLNENTGIKKVQILIEGKTVESLAGHIDISLPLESGESYPVN